MGGNSRGEGGRGHFWSQSARTVFSAKETPVHRTSCVSAPWGANSRMIEVTVMAVIRGRGTISFHLLGPLAPCGHVDKEGVLELWEDSGHYCSFFSSVVKSRKEILHGT